MRVSHKKGFLRIVEGLAGAQAAVAIATGLLVTDGLVTAASAQPLVMTNFVLLFPTFAVAVILSVEFTTLKRASQSWWQRNRGLNIEEMKQLVWWCPAPLLYLSLASAAAGFLGMLLSGGGVHWSSGQEFTSHHAVGFSLGTLVFCSISLPVLASASRMPDGFEAHVGKHHESRI